MSVMTMEEELKRIRELYDPRRDSTDIFAKQYRLPKHYEDLFTTDAGGEYGNGSVTGILPPYCPDPPVQLKGLYTRPEIRQSENDYTFGYSEEERMLHFDPTYRRHRRLVHAGAAATIIFGTLFVFSGTLFAIYIAEGPDTGYPIKITLTVLVITGVLVYVVRALVNWQFREAIGRVLGKGREWGCTAHSECLEQRYRLYGGRGWEMVFGSLVFVMVAFCVVSWRVEF
ncbi:hypothetical protein TWF730_003553 [Orbilia blumenaviensis]|uniref:Uncharacterized protein n=1 Tax=Orbilia blumenaviensis TaxID=1796055 RepID=A0AAV9U2E8_9PEZI